MLPGNLSPFCRWGFLSSFIPFLPFFSTANFKSHDHILLLEQSVLTNRGVHDNRKNSWHQRRSEHSYTGFKEYLLHGGYNFSVVVLFVVANLGFKLTRGLHEQARKNTSHGEDCLLSNKPNTITVFPRNFPPKNLFLIFSIFSLILSN